MKRSLTILAILPMLLSGCGLTRIVTVSPDYGSYNTYSTVVTVPRTHTTTTTTRVYAADNDISLYLDLKAVGAAFAQSSTVQEFESLLNNASYMLSNLDLNGDGYVDYLRVLETLEGHTHVFLIQAVLANNVYQDVATLVAELPSISTACVQIIGSPYLYGPSYIIQPVFYTRPLIYTHLMRVAYTPWRSPWHWDYFPTYYRHPAPILLSHYHAYIDTFMTNHRYCHHVDYARYCHFPDYDRVSRPHQRNDYGSQHPERAFEVRTSSYTATPAGQASGRPMNARDIREQLDASSVTSTGKSAGASTARGASLSGNGPVRSASSVTSGSTATPARSSVATGSASTARSSATTGSASSTARSSATTGSASSTARSASSTGSTTARSAASSGSTARSATSTGTGRSSAAQTTVRSRVSNTGSTNTRTTSVSESGQKTTVRRGSTSSSASSGNVRSSSSSASSARSTAPSAATSRSSSSAGSSSGASATRNAASGSNSRSGAGSSTARGASSAGRR